MEEPWAGIQGPEEAQLCVVDMPEPPRSPGDTRPLPRGKRFTRFSATFIPGMGPHWLTSLSAFNPSHNDWLSFFLFFSSSYVPVAKLMRHRDVCSGYRKSEMLSPPLEG